MPSKQLSPDFWLPAPGRDLAEQWALFPRFVLGVQAEDPADLPCPMQLLHSKLPLPATWKETSCRWTFCCQHHGRIVLLFPKVLGSVRWFDVNPVSLSFGLSSALLLFHPHHLPLGSDGVPHLFVLPTSSSPLFCQSRRCWENGGKGMFHTLSSFEVPSGFGLP